MKKILQFAFLGAIMSVMNRLDTKNEWPEWLGCNVNVVHRRLVSDIDKHWHDFYELEIILAGSGIMHINGKQYEIKRGLFYLLTPSDIHGYSVTGSVELVNLTFTPEAIENTVFAERLYPMECIIGCADESSLEKLAFYVDRMDEETRSDKCFSVKYISALLSCALVELYRVGELNKADSSSTYMPIQKALYYIRTHFKEELTVKAIADFAGVSAVTLGRKFNEQLKLNVKEYIIDFRLSYAKKLILQTRESITDIAFYCGFNSLSYFQRSFEQRYGIPPKRYRRINVAEGSEKAKEEGNT